jgi:biotin transporter BioY
MIYLGGASWLAVMVGDVGVALRQGVLPFIAVDAAKALIAALVASSGRLWLRPQA